MKNLFKFILQHPELLSQNHISFDLLHNVPKEKFELYSYCNQELLLIEECPEIMDYIFSGYQVEIREKRYLTILVDEWTRIKRDIKIYQIENV